MLTTFVFPRQLVGMFLHKPFLLLLIIFALIGSCYCSYEDGTLSAGIYGTYKKYKPSHTSFFRSKPAIFSSTKRRNRPHSPSSFSTVVNVHDFGAKGYGKDDTQAFKAAWKKACSKGSTLVVPGRRSYHLKPVRFSGPCHPNFALKIYGTIKASPHISDYEKDRRHWLVFENIANFKIDGGGIINGNGRIWWQNSCKINNSLPCKDGPTAVTFLECNNLRVSNLMFHNSQQMHLAFQKCSNVVASNLLVSAPGNSPNTDGIHVTETQNIQIKNCVIRTGDDCISIVSGSRNVRASDITCGPGHGISIGSLGEGNSEAFVSNVLVNRAIFTGTTNGVRIKTWQGGSGYAKNIRFQNVAMYNVSNPIIIDQHYCDRKQPCYDQVSAVEVSNVIYQNIRGTSASETAIRFDCSRTVPCRGIMVQDVTLVHEGDGRAKALCANIGYAKIGKFSPKCT